MPLYRTEMTKRKKIQPETINNVLLESARRCALCYGLDGNLSKKAGQIAHIDRNSSNSIEANLVFLCLAHHDEYDSITSQSKGITVGEIRHYKKGLMEAVARGEHFRFESAKSPTQRRIDSIQEHDEWIFRKANSIMSEVFLREFLDQLQTDDSYYSSALLNLDRFCTFFKDAGNQFINDTILGPLKSLIDSLITLDAFLSFHFFVFPDQQSNVDRLRLCMYPELNIDRGGSGSDQEMQRYREYQIQLDDLAEAARGAFQKYRQNVKMTLIL